MSARSSVDGSYTKETVSNLSEIFVANWLLGQDELLFDIANQFSNYLKTASL